MTGLWLVLLGLMVRFWLVVLEWANGTFGFGSRPYMWALDRAASAEWRRDRVRAYRVSAGEAYAGGLGTVRECRECGRSAFGGVTLCDRCDPHGDELPW